MGFGDKELLNLSYLKQLLTLFGVELIKLVRFTPMQCTAPCNSPVNTESLRFKVKLILKGTDLSRYGMHYRKLFTSLFGDMT